VDFVRAVRRVTDDLPYRLLGGRRPLSTVYVRQHLSDLREEQVPVPDEEPEFGFEADPPDRPPPRVSAAVNSWRPRQPADDILAQHRHLLIEAPAGLGKSTLGYRIAGQLAGAWLDQNPPPLPTPLLPLVVPARVLTEHGSVPLEAALAAAAANEYGPFTSTMLPPAAFARPLDGAAWFVVIDALDEVPGSRGRSRLFAQLAHAMANPHSPLRFLITTRPLSLGETTQLQGADVGFYELAPFDERALREFADHWFNPRHTADGHGDAQRFLDQVYAAGLADVLEVPLLAAVAALVHEQAQTRPLPTNRIQLYERYIDDLSRERQGTSCLPDQFRDNHRLLLEELALFYTTTETPLLDVARAFAAGFAPDVSEQDLIQACTHGSLLVPAGRDLRFIHHTFAEHLAADGLARKLPAAFTTDDQGCVGYLRRALHSDARSRKVLLHYLHRPGTEPALIDYLQSGTAAHREIAEFLIGEGAPISDGQLRRHLDRLRHRVVTGDDVSGEVRALAARTQHPATRELLDLVARDAAAPADCRIEAVRVLAATTPDARAAAPRLYDQVTAVTDTLEIRRAAARARAQLGGTEAQVAADHLIQLATGDGFPVGDRIEAATSLAEIGPQHQARAGALLVEIATDRHIDSSLRLTAAERVIGLTDEFRAAGTAALRALCDPRWSFFVRRDAAEALMRAGAGRDPHGLATLHALADDTMLPESSRLYASVTLAIFDSSRRASAVTAVRAYVSDTRKPPADRPESVLRLRALGPHLTEIVAEHLEEITRETGPMNHAARRAVDLLERLGPTFHGRAAAARARLAHDRTMNDYARIHFIAGAAALDPRYQAEAVKLLTGLLTDPALDSDIRAAAAVELVKVSEDHRSAVIEIFRGMLAGPFATVSERLTAAKNVADLDAGARPGILALLYQVSLTADRAADRVEAVDQLLALDSGFREPAVRVLTEVARDPGTDPEERRSAIGTISRLGPDHAELAATLLNTLGRCPLVDGQSRLQVACDLAQLSISQWPAASALVTQTWNSADRHDNLHTSIGNLLTSGPLPTPELLRILDEVARNPAADPELRQQASGNLCLYFEGQRPDDDNVGIELLQMLAEDRLGGSVARTAAARQLGWAAGDGPKVAANVLLSVVGDADLPLLERLQAMEQIVSLPLSHVVGSAEKALRCIINGLPPTTARALEHLFAAGDCGVGSESLSVFSARERLAVLGFLAAAGRGSAAELTARLLPDAGELPALDRYSLAYLLEAQGSSASENAVGVLSSVAADPAAEFSTRIGAAKRLAQLSTEGRARAATHLSILAESTTTPPQHRINAARHLAGLGSENSMTAVKVLDRLTREPSPSAARFAAGEALIQMGSIHREPAVRALEVLAADDGADLVDRASAQRLLTQWGITAGDPPEVGLRRALRRLPPGSWHHRWAAEELITLGPVNREQAADSLSDIAGRSDAVAWHRLWAAALLRTCGDRHAPEAHRSLRGLAEDAGNDWWTRIRATRFLSGHGGPGPGEVASLLHDLMLEAAATGTRASLAEIALLYARTGLDQLATAADLLERSLEATPEPEIVTLTVLARLAPEHRPTAAASLTEIVQNESRILDDRVLAAGALMWTNPANGPAMTAVLRDILLGAGASRARVKAADELGARSISQDAALQEAVRALTVDADPYVRAVASVVGRPRLIESEREVAHLLDTVIGDPATTGDDRGELLDQLENLGFLFPGRLPGSI
jgi:cellulose synthase operon protein C